MGGEVWMENPLLTVPSRCFTVIDLWLACRSTRAEGAAALPCAGGVGDQPAALWDSFGLLDGWNGNEGLWSSC